MSAEQIMGAVAFFVLVSGAMWGIWWRIEGKVKIAEDKADKAQQDLAAHKLHAAETFATKAGMQEQTAQLLRAIEGVGNRIDGLHERLDRAFERQPTRRAS